MNITQQDIDLLKYLHAVKVSTYKKIHRDIYPTHKLNSVRERVFKLTKMKLIYGYQDRLYMNGEKLLSVSKHGFETFIKTGEEKVVEIKSEVITHDLALVDIRHCFLQTSKISMYQTENQIQAWGIVDDNQLEHEFLRRTRCDAVAKIALSRGNFWASIEYERSDKTLNHYQSIVNKYYSEYDLPLVFYICENTRIVKKIISQEKEFLCDYTPKIFYQVLHELINMHTMVFYNCNNQYLEIVKDRPDYKLHFTTTKHLRDSYESTRN